MVLVVVVARQSSDFYECRCLRSIVDDVFFDSKGDMVASAVVSVNPQSSHNHGDFRGFSQFLQVTYCGSTLK